MGKNIDWSNLGFGYVKTDYRYVSNFKNGAWDEGTLSTDDMVTISECACVLQYAQTVFEGMKAYTTEDASLYSARTSTQSVWRIPQKDWKCLYSRKIVS